MTTRNITLKDTQGQNAELGNFVAGDRVICAFAPGTNVGRNGGITISGDSFDHYIGPGTVSQDGADVATIGADSNASLQLVYNLQAKLGTVKLNASATPNAAFAFDVLLDCHLRYNFSPPPAGHHG